MIVTNVHVVVNRANLAYADVILGADLDCKGRLEETRSKNTIRLVYGEYSKGLVKISDEWERDLIGQMVTQKKTKM